MMNPELKAKWLAALRSGEYKQTTGVLKGAKGYCCLGVLCDISGVGSWEIKSGDYATYVCPDGTRSWSTLPTQMKYSVGLDAMVLANAVGYNDDGKSFTYIADYLEEYA